ncbi:unnamed protein product [Phytomonas sp. EM1]|nr:unnamed protein product [Phytomonas sp. EM1]|eukprot:CCW59862.1 unnamed protein product [Phytomonas sp. isolate EM1]
MQMRLFATSRLLFGVISRGRFLECYRNTSGGELSSQSSMPLGSSSRLMDNTQTLHSTVEPVCNKSSVSSELTTRATSQMSALRESKPTIASLPWHVNLIEKILSNKTLPFTTKQKRITGVVQKLETHHLEWLEEVAMDSNLPFHCYALLRALTKALPFFRDPRRGRREGCSYTSEEDSKWSAASPYFSESLNDSLCVCLRTAIPKHSTTAELTTLLRGAVELELADLSSLKHISYKLTSRDRWMGSSASDAVEVLWLLSLAVRRCKLPPPPVNHLLCRLPSSKLTPREGLQVFSALIRLNDRAGNEVFEILSRRAVEDVGAYTTQDAIFALQAVALLDNSHIAFAGATIERCAELAPRMSAKNIGDIAKSLALLHSGRKYNVVAEGCAKELQRTLAAVATRAEELLGLFSLRDARHVLKCLTVHKVRHTILFSRLTPFVSDD